MNEYPLPEPFIRRIKSQLEEGQELLDSLENEARTSVRLNPSKQPLTSERMNGDPIPWNENGRYLSERPKFSLDPLYQAGLYYPMESSSMFLTEVLKQISVLKDAILLDLCAAPGGKSLILKDAFPDNVLVSNEIDGKRVHVLKENALRWGTENHLVIHSDAARLQKSGIGFDLILVDAPCSGEGLFRKDKKSRTEWTEERAQGCALRQSDILDDVMPLLASGGWLIYSTCTFNPAENMEQVNRLIQSYGLESYQLKLTEEWAIEELKEGQAIGYQFWPHRVEGEGFFVSVLRQPMRREKQDISERKPTADAFPFLPDVDLSDLLIQKFDDRYFAFTPQELILLPKLNLCGNVIKKGLILGELKGRDFIPSYDFSANIRSTVFPNKLELSPADALDYLRGIALRTATTAGVVVLTYKGLNLGFGKSNGSRINNLLPKHLRIN